MSTILLLLDAFRNDYLTEQTTPFLWKCAMEGEYYKNVEQSYGFCERTEIFTGKPASESGFFTAIGYDPINSPYKNINGLLLLYMVEQMVLLLLHIAPKKIGSRVHNRLHKTN